MKSRDHVQISTSASTRAGDLEKRKKKMLVRRDTQIWPVARRVPVLIPFSMRIPATPARCRGTYLVRYMGT